MTSLPMVPVAVAKGAQDQKAVKAEEDPIKIAIQKGNINIGSKSDGVLLELSESSKAAQEVHAETLRKLEAQKRARGIVVPTAIEEVKAKLRELGHPVTLFGENPADRRIRLQEVIATLELDTDDVKQIQKLLNESPAAEVSEKQAHVPSQKEVFYTPAQEECIVARTYISNMSFVRSRDRIRGVKRVRESEDLSREEDEHAAKLYMHFKNLSLNASQYADDRPPTCVRYSPCGRMLLTGALTSLAKVFDVDTLECMYTLNGHKERITSVCWSAAGSESAGESVPLCLTSCADKTVVVWGRDNTILRTLLGHEGVVACVNEHPSGRYVGTASHDYTWRLWDLETGQQIWLQDGHLRECACIDFQCDGALVLTGDYAGVAHVWDLRSGQSVYTAVGHTKKVLNAQFSPNGWQVATGGDDHMVRIWDMRRRKCSYVLPAHSNVISDVRFSPSGELLVTSSFDGTVKVWNARDMTIIKGLSGHTGKVMGCDISPGERELASVGFDRTLKLWAHRELF